MRAIDADALEKEGWSLHRTIRVNKNTEEYQTKPLRKVPAIEPRCETCEAFNKTRLLIPQPQRKKGKWKQVRVNGFTPGGNCLSVCSECGWEFGTHMIYPDYNFCPNCGADMTEGKE